MIEGMRLDVTADEIVKLIDARIAEHAGNAKADEANAKKLDETDREGDEDECWDDDTNASMRLRRRAQRERDRIEALTFMRNHLVRGETYRLTADDLRTLEVLPARYY